MKNKCRQSEPELWGMAFIPGAFAHAGTAQCQALQEMTDGDSRNSVHRNAAGCTGRLMSPRCDPGQVLLQWDVILCLATLCHAMLHFAVPRLAVPCLIALCFAMSCYAVLQQPCTRAASSMHGSNLCEDTKQEQAQPEAQPALPETQWAWKTPLFSMKRGWQEDGAALPCSSCSGLTLATTCTSITAELAFLILVIIWHTVLHLLPSSPSCFSLYPAAAKIIFPTLIFYYSKWLHLGFMNRKQIIHTVIQWTDFTLKLIT